MSTVSSSNLKNKRTDIAFFIYFTVMALLFTKTYIQLAAQLGIIAYVVYQRAIVKQVKEKTVRTSLIYIIAWFGGFVLLAKLSEMWAYSTKLNSNTNLTLFRILVIAIVLFWYVTDYCKAIGVIKAFIYSNVIMALFVMLVTPLSQYGKAGEDGFGDVIGQQRNTFGATMAFLVFICILFYQYENFKNGKPLACFFVIALLCSGSRGAMLQLLIAAVLYVITIPGLKRKMKYVFGAIVVAIIAVIMLQNIPYLHDIVWVRFEGLINTVLGVDVTADSSARGRELYKVLAWEMFDNKPILGYGVDGFFCYLRDVEYVEGMYLPARYSHCNFTEIASCFGSVGLIVWYAPLFYILFDSFKLRKKAMQMNIVFLSLAAMMILDYARIPWMYHMTMYLYFCNILLYFYVKNELNRKQNKLYTLDYFQSIWEEKDK